jgi:hypothetical protein
MMHFAYWPWILLFVLGAYHGANPGMGWLFAVALGLQKHESRAVWYALIPIAVGHVIAIGLAVLIAAIAGALVPIIYVKIAVALLLIGFGLLKLLGKGHLRWGGMQVDFKDLTVWSFLMASAHGAGLMVLPILLGMSIGNGDHGAHVQGMSFVGTDLQILAVIVHTIGYLLVTGAVAWIVYTRLGVSILRTAWFNMDRIWAMALLVTATLTLVVPR